ncbi:MAG TPA: pyridoxal phosphate-dependent aminotransferase [Blastocatellia bacterium]|nr:pyridoxal phosphate-dependent aminotransferase [Blastocatellia bacterium]
MSLSRTVDSLSLGKIVVIREQLLKAQSAGQKVYRFESGDPSFSVAPHVLEALKRSADDGKTHYIPNNGIPELKSAIYDKVRTKNKIPINSENDIFVTNGAMHALFVTFASLLDEGDEVIVPDPMWTEVVENIKLAGGVPIGIPLRFENNFTYDISDIARRINSRTKAIFINTPHNPTGAVLSRNQLSELVALAERHNLWIVSDEAYEDVIYTPEGHCSIGSLASDNANKIISVFSFSKSHAMSGLRVGYIVTTNKLLHDRIPKLLRCTINGVNSIGQWAALAALNGGQLHLQVMRSEYEERRDLMVRALSGIDGIRIFEPKGAFYLWTELESTFLDEIGCSSADELSAALAANGLGSAPGDAFGETCANSIRFAFSCNTSMVREGSAVLRAFLMNDAQDALAGTSQISMAGGK